MFFKRKSQENKVLDDLETDKDLRFRLMLEHGTDWEEYYYREVYKDQPKLLEVMLDCIRHEKGNRK